MIIPFIFAIAFLGYGIELGFHDGQARPNDTSFFVPHTEAK